MSGRCTVVIANAGSGKTWTLANRILRWAIESIREGRGAQAERVLAVTFTRKAAGEILARVLAHAAQGAAEGEAGARARDEYAAVVGAATREEYAEALEALCAELHRLQIGTIDGFFHRVASAMPDEIGLPAEWTLGEDRELEAIRARAAAEVLASEGAADLVALLERGEPKPSVTSAIAGLLGGEGVTPLEVYRATAADGPETVARAWGWIDELAKSAPSGAWDDLVARADALVSPVSDARWERALATVRELLREKDLRGLAENGFFLKMHAGESYYKRDMPGEFTALAAHVAAHLRHGLVAEVARQMRGALEALPRASAALERLQRAEGVYGFDDLGRGVARAAQRTGSRVADPAALRAALGADVRDLAIDEAQDTSVEQFLALQPLLAEVLGGARGGRFLLVGDPKQSIYGWRGGTPGLIDHIGRVYARSLGPGESLTKSYRSSPIVMDFVNRVFENLEADVLAEVPDEHKGELVAIAGWASARGLPPDATGSAFTRALRQWRFARHESARPTLAGRIAAYAFGERKEAGDAPPTKLSACACAARIAARLHREDPSRTIAVLVRKNTDIAETIAELKALGIAASDEGRATLLDSPAVVGVAAMLRLVDDPGDRISHFLVSRGAMRSVTGLAPLESHATPAESHAAAIDFAARMRAAIADRGLAAVVREAFDALRALGLSQRDAGRLARMVALAEEESAAPRARLVDFLDAVAADTADASTSDPVRVMTIHRAKGLEFDEVIVASLDSAWGAAGSDWGMLAVDPTKPPLLVAPLMNEGVRKWVPELSVLERDERRRSLLDDVSALYVALTRARRGLHLVMKSEAGGSLPTAAKLVARAMSRDASAPDTLVGAEPFSAAFKAAAPDAEKPFWSHAFGAPEAEKASSAPARAPMEAVAAAAPPITVVPRARARAAAPSTHAPAASGGGGHDAPASFDPWQFDPFTDDDIALRGVLVHECFREVESAAAIADEGARAALAARAARRAAVEKGEPVGADMTREAAGLLARVAAGPLAAALRAGAGIRVRTELPFVRDTPAGLVHGRIDRLELDERDGRVVGATIVDFKTGAEKADGPALGAKVESYFEQLSGYADAVAEMHGIDRGAIRMRLLFVDRDEVVERVAGSP